MRLIIPTSGVPSVPEARLLRLADLLGVRSEFRAQPGTEADLVPYFESLADEGDSCVALNAAAVRACADGANLSERLGRCLTARFRGLIVYNLEATPLADNLVRGLSGGAIDHIHLAGGGVSYSVPTSGRGITQAFAGLTFGPADPADRSFDVHGDTPTCETLVKVDKRALMAVLVRDRCQAYFLGSPEVADLDANVLGTPFTSYFSRLLPFAFALRALFAPRCWIPARPRATLIVDDPLLQKRYGFLDYQRLLALMDRFDFHTSVGFIPHNYKRSSQSTVRLFRTRPDRFSICFHGSQHTQAEFAGREPDKLHAMLALADEYMSEHTRRTGIECERVMVFPQGKFSVEAMAALKKQNFVAATNTVPFPTDGPATLPLAETLQPAVLKYADFPLFLRYYPQDIRAEQMAAQAFFGRPLLFAAHHDTFMNPAALLGAISRLNQMLPGVRWGSLEQAVSGSYLTRCAETGDCVFRLFASRGVVEYSGPGTRGVSLEWPFPRAHVEQVLFNGLEAAEVSGGESHTRVGSVMRPGQGLRFRLLFRDDPPNSAYHINRTWKVRAYVRRRLSEFRDNYLSKSPTMLAAAQTFQRRFRS